MTKTQRINLSFWTAFAWLLILFVAGLLFSDRIEAHEIHLSGQDDLTTVSIMDHCDNATYAVATEELGCILLYKHIDLTHSGVHIKFLPYTAGQCVCPEEDATDD